LPESRSSLKRSRPSSTLPLSRESPREGLLDGGKSSSSSDPLETNPVLLTRLCGRVPFLADVGHVAVFYGRQTDRAEILQVVEALLAVDSGTGRSGAPDRLDLVRLPEDLSADHARLLLVRPQTQPKQFATGKKAITRASTVLFGT
jgi:hypothetical protein